MPEEDPNRQPILQLMGEMYNRQARIGYYLLYFIKVGSVTALIDPGTLCLRVFLNLK